MWKIESKYFSMCRKFQKNLEKLNKGEHRGSEFLAKNRFEQKVHLSCKYLQY